MTVRSGAWRDFGRSWHTAASHILVTLVSHIHETIVEMAQPMLRCVLIELLRMISG
jgi:hypothetical protein